MTPLWANNMQAGSSRPVLSQEWRTGEELIRKGGDVGVNRTLCSLVSRHLHHAEVFLCDKMPFHAKAKLVASRRGEDQGRDIDPKIGNLKAVADGDIRKGGPADELFVVEVDQIDVEVIRPCGIGEAEIQPHV